MSRNYHGGEVVGLSDTEKEDISNPLGETWLG